MLMAADDRSDLWQQSIDIDDDDDGLSIDIESLWEILGESPPDTGPLQVGCDSYCQGFVCCGRFAS